MWLSYGCVYPLFVRGEDVPVAHHPLERSCLTFFEVRS